VLAVIAWTFGVDTAAEFRGAICRHGVVVTPLLVNVDVLLVGASEDGRAMTEVPGHAFERRTVDETLHALQVRLLGVNVGASRALRQRLVTPGVDFAARRPIAACDVPGPMR
jgi:hypothetical protein